jgi:periplasmic mercuric ion binding protein
MKALQNILAMILVAIIFTNCKNEAKPEVKTIETDVAVTTEKALNPDAHFVKTEFTIDGMTCAIGCAKTIESKITKMDGVKSATVDFDKKLAMVEYDVAVVNHEALEATVSKTADIYKVSNMKDVDAFEDKE